MVYRVLYHRMYGTCSSKSLPKPPYLLLYKGKIEKRRLEHRQIRKEKRAACQSKIKKKQHAFNKFP